MSLRVWFRRIRELEVLNEELRSALKLCLKQLKGFKSSGTSPLIFRPHLRCLSTLNVNTVGKNTSAEPHVLCHTPHYIDKPDKHGYRANPESLKVTGYQQAGHF
jgi:hypothetical protein